MSKAASGATGNADEIEMREWRCGHCRIPALFPDGAALRRLRISQQKPLKELAYDVGCTEQLLGMIEANAKRPTDALLDWAQSVGGPSWERALSRSAMRCASSAD